MFGQLVIGAPGAGKSTYCNAMAQLLDALHRRTVLVNLDPANQLMPYQCQVDMRQLITVQDVMNTLHLGPNGALRYCMRTLCNNMDWLRAELNKHQGYLLVDLPGQVELYNSDACISSIIRQMEGWGHRLVVMHLSDSLHCADAGKFVSVVLSALAVTVNLETAHINVLSKMDLFSDALPFHRDFFAHLPNLRRVLELMEDNAILQRYRKLNIALCDVIDTFDLVSMQPCSVLDRHSMLALLNTADLANGFALLNHDPRGLLSHNE